MGTSVTLQVPSNVCNKLIEVAVCAIFVLYQHHPLHQLHLDYEEGYKFMHKLWWYLKANGYESPQIRHRFPFLEELVIAYPRVARANFFRIVSINII